MLDLKTGLVRNAIVVQSTGYKTLDNNALVALRRWHWKPGRWKEIDIPITFLSSATQLPPKASLVPMPIHR